MAIVAGKRVVKQGEGGGIHRHLDLLAIGIGLLPAQQETAKRLGAVDIKAVGQRLGITEIAPLREGQAKLSLRYMTSKSVGTAPANGVPA